jgi:hypothetical protein
VSVFRGDASEVYTLAASLAGVGAKMVPALRGSMLEVGNSFAREWHDNAVETSGEHGKHYPKSIDAELVFDLSGISVDVGPNTSKPQGKMGRGFEFGSKNQPPHLDGLRALDGHQKRAEKVIEVTVGFLIP